MRNNPALLKFKSLFVFIPVIFLVGLQAGEVAEHKPVAPGGRTAEFAQRVEPGEVIQVKPDRVLLRNEEAGTVREFPRLAASAERQAPIDSGWTTWAYWGTSGTGVTYLTTTWTVPPPPATNDNQIIYLFNGIVNYDGLPDEGILQPVLQWGVTPAGGGPYWAVASWYVLPSNQLFSSLVPVNPGDTLAGVMQQTGQNGNLCSYSCQFQGIDGTTLTVQDVPQLWWANETLECYYINHASDYPTELATAMSGIQLQTGNTTSQTLDWTVQSGFTDYGQHTVVVNTSNGAGEVDLYYFSAPDHFAVTGTDGNPIPEQAAGNPFNIKIVAQDANNNIATDFVGTAEISSTGTLSFGSLGSAPFVNGVLASQSVMLTNSGSFTITASLLGGGNPSGTSNAFQVSGVVYFSVRGSDGNPIGAQTAGQPFDIMVIAKDINDNVATGFSGTVDISSTGTLSAGAGTTANFVNGVLSSLSVTITNTGLFTLTATQTGGGPTGTGGPFFVDPGALAQFAVTGANGDPISGQMVGYPFNIQVTAQDAYANTITNFSGTVDITSSGTLFSGYGTSPNFVNGILTGLAVTFANTGTFSLTTTQTGGGSSGTSSSFAVAPAPLTVAAAAKSQVYGDSPPALTYTCTGLVNGDQSATLTGALATTATSASGVGTYQITEGTLAATGTYTIGSYNGANLTVTPATLAVTANSLSSTYGLVEPSLTYTITGFKNGDGAGVITGVPALHAAVTSSSPAGNYDITVNTGNMSAANYIFTGVAGTLTVIPAALTVSVEAQSIPYGTPLPTLTYSYSGLVNGDTSAVFTGALATTAQAGAAVGSYPITQGTLAAAGNYTLGVFNGAGLMITPATPPTITSAFAASATEGVFFSYQILAGGSAPMTFSAANLPAGLSLADGIISGTPAVSGAANIALAASNAGGVDNEILALAIAPSGGIIPPPPQVETPPATPAPVAAGQPVALSVSASDPGVDLISYSWNFGDHTTGSGAAVNHTYANPGVYTATVTISNGVNSVNASVNVVINAPGLATDPTQFAVTKKAFSFNFDKSQADSMSIAGKLPVTIGFKPAGKSLAVIVGGYVSNFILSPKGQGRSNTRIASLFRAESRMAL